jgi:hypothetical protein
MKMLIAAALIVTSAPVIAAVASGENGAAQPNQERRICRRLRGSSSSTRIERRVCMTRAQWNAQQDGSVDDEMSELETRTQTIPTYEDGIRHKGERPN